MIRLAYVAGILLALSGGSLGDPIRQHRMRTIDGGTICFKGTTKPDVRLGLAAPFGCRAASCAQTSRLWCGGVHQARMVRPNLPLILGISF